MSGISRKFALWALGVAGLVAFAGAAPASASGYDLNGRTAPDMVFPTGMNGVPSGLSLSSLRGKVVWVKFVLRDCPRCKLELPRAQQLHDRWGKSGLVVLVVVHQLGPQQMSGFMRQNGYTFRLGTDPRGEFAKRYGVRHRPADYVVGVDGRIVASNSAPDSVIRTELGRYRLMQLGRVPKEFESVRRAVWNWDYGTALRTVEEAAAKEDATPELRQLLETVLGLSRKELQAQEARARELERRRQVVEARTLYDRLATHFQDTSLASEAAKLRRQFEVRIGQR